VEFFAILLRLISESNTFYCILIPRVGIIFCVASNSRRLKPVPYTQLKSGLQGYIVDTVVGVAVHGTTHLLPHDGLRLVTFWMLRDKCAMQNSAHGLETRGLIAKQNCTQHNHNTVSNRYGSDTTWAMSHNPLPSSYELLVNYCQIMTSWAPRYGILN